MEVLVFVGALFALDILALRFGSDSTVLAHQRDEIRKRGIF